MIRIILKFFRFVFGKLRNGLKKHENKDKPLINKEPDEVNYSFEYVEDIPETLSNCVIYIVGEKGFNWVVVFICPCGCKEIIHLNLLKETKPCWKVINSKKSFSISPSIDRLVNCKSHFTITNNKIIWWNSIN